MEWQDQGIILSARPHGEGSAIVELFTAAHGRHSGVVRGGSSRRMAPLLQPGTQVAAQWRARLSDHLGALVLEPQRSRAAILSDPLALAALGSVCALLHQALPERDPHPALYGATVDCLDALAAGQGVAYLAWEIRLLADLGFGLDLTACAVTGQRDDLAYVSPRTGRAVSRAAAGDWADRLFPLPQALVTGTPPSLQDMAQGLVITGHFLTREMAHGAGARPLPDARARLLARLSPAAAGR